MATTSTSSSAITIGGLSSGIDTASIITKMVTLAQKPIAALATKDDGYNSELTEWRTVNTKLSTLKASAATLGQASTYKATSAASSTATVASITSYSTTPVGDHQLVVTNLAQAQKLVTNSNATATAALGVTGSFTLNGKQISVNAQNSLNDVATRINAAKAGVTATIVTVGANDYRMTLTSNATGTANAISAADIGSGTLLSSLGLATGAAAIRQPLSYNQSGNAYSGASSMSLTGATGVVGTLMGAAAGTAASGTVHIAGVSDGADVAIDLNSDTLTDIANKINAAGVTGVTAQIVGIPDANGNVSPYSKQQLQIVGVGSSPTFTDSNNVLASLGVLQQGAAAANKVTDAADAKFTLDGLALTRSSNTVTDAIQGASIKLLSGTVATPGTTTLSISQDTASIVKSVNDFVTAYNDIQDYVAAQNKFTAPTAATGTTAATAPLFGDSTLTSIQTQLSRTLGIASGGSTLMSLGIKMGDGGKLTLDSSTLTNALQTDSNKVSSFFGLSGTTDDSNVQYVIGGDKTKGTTGAGYAVNITQPATQTRAVASIAQTGPAAAAETLTFTGASFTSSVKITLAKGNTLQDTVNQINGDSNLNSTVYASIDSTTNTLKISTQRYGAASNFNVASDQAASATSTGLGAAPVVTTGTDVHGTINGELATGIGQILGGNVGNPNTEGLQLLISASTTGTFGHTKITHGVADSLISSIAQMLDPENGAVTSAQKTLTDQITAVEKEITAANDSVSTYQDYLTQMFSDMETRMSSLQSQGTAFAAQAANLPNYSSSKN
ncbi:MAG: Flagellar capping protein [Capsulimonas sp.]|nr:Flagellar capping protein [Capsulimonas sp.]